MSRPITTRVFLAVMVAAAASACASMTVVGPTLTDRQAIEATLYRYARGLDRHDPDLYASAWAEDGEFRLGDTVYRGREDMRGIVADLIERHAAAQARGEPARQVFHMVANARVEFLASDHAIHHAYYLTLARTGEGAEGKIDVVAAGSSTDELRKINGEWLIVRREVTNAP